MKKTLAGAGLALCLVIATVFAQKQFPTLNPKTGDDQLTTLQKILTVLNNQVSVPTTASKGAGIIDANTLRLTLASDQPAIAVTTSTAARTVTTSSVTGSGTVAAGKRHIEFNFSSDFAGTIGGTTVTAGMITAGRYSVGDISGNDTFGALTYTITAGSAFLTTW